MAYPASLDDLTNPLASDPRVGHAALHGSVNDAIEALEAKVGTGASTPATIGDVLTVTGPGATAWQTPAAGGGTQFVDLGTLDLADLLDGPITVYDIPADTYLVSLHAPASETVAMDSALIYLGTGLGAEEYTVGGSFTGGPSSLPSGVPYLAWIAETNANGNVVATGWDAATAYAAYNAIIVNGTIWVTDGGTSGGVEPDWASNVGWSVSDNGMTWTDSTTVAPTTGSVHLLALVGTPVAP